jgi:hypothetical protein
VRMRWRTADALLHIDADLAVEDLAPVRVVFGRNPPVGSGRRDGELGLDAQAHPQQRRLLSEVGDKEGRALAQLHRMRAAHTHGTAPTRQLHKLHLARLVGPLGAQMHTHRRRVVTGQLGLGEDVQARGGDDVIVADGLL